MPVSEDSIPKNKIPENRAVLFGLRGDERERFNKVSEEKLGSLGTLLPPSTVYPLQLLVKFTSITSFPIGLFRGDTIR